MKYHYLLILFITSFFSYGQNNCDTANSYLVNAYSHVKDAYDSNNISHLKYYANRSVESFNLAKKTLETCGCLTALDLTDKALDLLKKVEFAETNEDGRFYVKRAREISKESVIEVDKCTISTNSPIEIEDTELTDLQQEQLRLQEQQEALKRKEEQLKTKLAEQKEKELMLKKKQLILSYENAITQNIETYNQTLKVCNCGHELVELNTSQEDVSTKSLNDIKIYYTDSLKTIASNYISQLKDCNN